MTKYLCAASLALTALLLPMAAAAQEQTARASGDAQATPFGAVQPIADTRLAAVTGRDDLAQVVSAQNKGVVTGNTVSGHSQTGTIQFDASSFRNLNGLSLLSANTGNNVSINSSLNVNVAISSR